MSAKLDEKQRAEIIAAYAEGGVSYQDLGQKYGVSYKTIERAIKSDTDGLSKKVKEIKERTAVDVTEHIKGRSGVAMDLFDDILNELRRKLPKATARELFGGLKILSEVFAPQTQNGTGDGSEAVKINVIFGDTSGADKPSEGPEQISTEEAQTYAE